MTPKEKKAFVKRMKKAKEDKKKGSKTKGKKSKVPKSTAVHDFIHNKPYGQGRTKAQALKISRANNKIVEKLRREGKW